MKRSRPAKAQTRTLLAQLLDKESKNTLIELWSDLSSLTRAEFEGLLDSVKGQATPKRSKSKPTKRTKQLDDTAPARIVKELQRTTGSNESLAATRLSNALSQAGVKAASIPPFTGTSLQSWIENLIKEVSETKVMAAARRLGA